MLELVEGPTLADRIAEGPLPLPESLDIAAQLADALDAAHEQGITHWDLKPANIKVHPDGVVKVLDFGLAKLADPSAGSELTDEAGLATTMSAAPAAIGAVALVAGLAIGGAFFRGMTRQAPAADADVLRFPLITPEGWRVHVPDGIINRPISASPHGPDLAREEDMAVDEEP